MAKHKSEAKDKKKSSQLVIRIDKAERDVFVALCDRMDTSAAREIRRFMREFVTERSGSGAEPDRAIVIEVIAEVIDIVQPSDGAATLEPGASAAASESEAVVAVESAKPRKPARARS